MRNLNSIEQILSNQLKSQSEKEASVDTLQSKLTSLSQRYDELHSKTEAAITSTVTSKTMQYEALLRDMSKQLTKLLYENTKLRRFIESQTGQVVPKLDYTLLVKENLGREDADLFASMEELIKQNSELKSKSYTFSASSHGAPKHETNEQEVNNLMKRLAASEQEVDRLKAARDNWKTQATGLLEQSSSLQKQLRNIQHEYGLLERKAATSEAIVEKLRRELDSVTTIVGPSEAFVER